MSAHNFTWATAFKHIPSLEKFVLTTLGDAIGGRGQTGLPLIPVAELPGIAECCNLDFDKFQNLVEQLTRRGLVRVAPGPAIELCTFVDPLEWNQRKEKQIEPAGKGAGNGHRS